MTTAPDDAAVWRDRSSTGASPSSRGWPTPAPIPTTARGDKAGATLPAGEPRMLLDDPTEPFKRYRKALVASGVRIGAGGGTAGIGDSLGGLLNGAKEALRGRRTGR